MASNRTTRVLTGGGEIEFRAKLSPKVSGIVSYAFQQNNLDPVTDAQTAYSPKHKATGILTVNPVERLSVNFDVNAWGSFYTASPGLTPGLANAAPNGILFQKHIGDPYAIGNISVNYPLVPESEFCFGLGFQLRNVFDRTVQETPVPAVDTSLRGREVFARVYYKF